MSSTSPSNHLSNSSNNQNTPNARTGNNTTTGDSNENLNASRQQREKHKNQSPSPQQQHHQQQSNLNPSNEPSSDTINNDNNNNKNNNKNDNNNNNNNSNNNNNKNNNKNDNNNNKVPKKNNRTVSSTEFKRLVEQSQVKLPPLSFLPKWIDEYSNSLSASASTSTSTSASTSTSDNSHLQHSERSATNDDNDKKTATTTNAITSKDNENTKSNENKTTKQKQNHQSASINLQNLPNDISSQILSFLPLEDILFYSQINKLCYKNGYKNDLVWKLKFMQRWNVNALSLNKHSHQTEKEEKEAQQNHFFDSVMIDSKYCVFQPLHDNDSDSDCDSDRDSGEEIETEMEQDDDSMFWRKCYYNAFHNVHDLWITHWNCVDPIDKVSAGRTVIPHVEFKPRPCTISTSNISASASASTLKNEFKNNKRKKKQTLSKELRGGRKEMNSDCKIDIARNHNNSNSKNSNGQDLLSKCPTCRNHPFWNYDGTQQLNAAMDDEVEFHLYHQQQHQHQQQQHQEQQKQHEQNIVVQDPVEIAEIQALSHSILLSKQKQHAAAATSSTTSSSTSAQTLTVTTTPARSIYYSTKYALAKWCRRMNLIHNIDLSKRTSDDYNVKSFLYSHEDERNTKSTSESSSSESSTPLPTTMSSTSKVQKHIYNQRKLSKYTFQEAATFNRKINTNQYNSSGLNFLSDALFFPITPSHKRLHVLESLIRDDIDKTTAGGGSDGNNSQGADSSNNNDNDGNNNDEQDSNMDDTVDNCKVQWNYKLTELEHSILDIYGSKFMDTEGANNTTSLKDLPPPQPMAPLTDITYHSPHDMSTLSSLGANSETAHHSWHVIRVSNPDFVRPITFRIYAQRTDCFSAFPSSGYLNPGETCFVTLNIRAMGSLLSEVYDDVDTKREEINMFVADIFEEESALPQCAFAIRYMYAPTIPCLPVDYYNCKDSNHNHTLHDEDEQQRTHQLRHRDQQQNHHLNVNDGQMNHCTDGLVQRLWNNVRSEDVVRTVHISAHVNGKFSFNEFQSKTMVPFDVHARPYKMSSLSTLSSSSTTNPHNYYQHCSPLTLVSPNLQLRDPKLFSMIHDMNLELDSSDQGLTYRTEKNCTCCGRSWGARSEYLGRIFVLRKAICEEHARQRSRQMHRVGECLRALPTLFKYILPDREKSITIDIDNILLNKIHQILYCLHAVVINRRGDKMITSAQRNVLQTFEIYENIAYEELTRIVKLFLEPENHKLSFKEEALFFWRQAGVYDNPRSTDSMDASKLQVKHIRQSYEGSADCIIKKEPPFIEGHKGLRHRPGLIPVGQAEDPNYFDQNASHLHSDIFKDSAVLGFMSSLAMTHDPRALCGQGIYHILPKGTISRCQSIESESFLSCGVEKDMQKLYDNALKHINEMEASVHYDFQLNNYDWGHNKLSLLQLDDPDPDSFKLFSIEGRNEVVDELSSLSNYTRNVPVPGVGRFPLSRIKTNEDKNIIEPIEIIRPMIQLNGRNQRRSFLRDRNRNRVGRRPPLLIGHLGFRAFNALWNLCSHFGWHIDDEGKPGKVLADRRILIAIQWLSNSLTFLPLLWTLLARWTTLISPYPLDYYLDGLPFDLSKEMRYLTSQECGWVAIVVFISWLSLGRYAERNINRTYERSMIDHSGFNLVCDKASSWDRQLVSSVLLRCERLWDYVCPLFIQRKIFTPHWNRRKHKDIVNYIKKVRCNDGREFQSIFYAGDGQKEGDRSLMSRQFPTISTKILVCCLVGAISFLACSPHYVLNFCTIFFGSIGMGLSMSINFMEICRAPQVSGILSKFDNMQLNVAVIMFFLVGQLVGSSGGVQFLAEFVVTVVGLLLGGAYSVSTSTLESWFCFFCLGFTAFWGYLLARVCLSTCIRGRRKSSSTSSLLLFSFLLVLSIWLPNCTNKNLDYPARIMIIRFGDIAETISSRKNVLSGQYIMKMI